MAACSGKNDRVPIRTAAIAGLLALAAIAAACSDEQSSTTTAPERPAAPSTTTTTIVPGSEPALEPDWAWQSGRPGPDDATGATGRLDTVVLVGEGQPIGATGPQAAPTGVGPVVVGLASADGQVRFTTEAPADGSADQPRGVSASPTGATLTCGSVRLQPAEVNGSDLWCSTVGPDGALGPRVGNGSEGDDEVSGVAMAADGTYGYVSATIDGLYPGAEDPTGGFLGERDALLLRTDPDGQPRWARQFGTQGDDRASAVGTIADGDAVVAGTASAEPFAFEDGSLRRGGADAWVARSDPSGNQRWITPFGTSADDDGLAVAAGGDPTRGTETVVGAGTTTGDVLVSTDGAEQLVAPGSTPAAGGTDVLVAGFDAAGRQQWITQAGSPGDDRATAAVVDGATVYVAGTAGAEIVGAQRVDVPGAPAGTTGGGSEAFLSAYDLATGTWRWTALFGSAADEQVTGLALTDDGHVVVVGTTLGAVASTPLGGPTDAFAVAFPVGSAGGGGAASAV